MTAAIGTLQLRVREPVMADKAKLMNKQMEKIEKEREKNKEMKPAASSSYKKPFRLSLIWRRLSSSPQSKILRGSVD